MNPKKSDSRPGAALTAGIALCCLLAVPLAGCGRDDSALGLDDLSPAELRYVERFVVLERARAVALDDRAAGEALLDSLAAAWGDSALAEAQAAIVTGPERLAELHLLLGRILDAERDSLLRSPSAARLAAPLPDPPPEDGDRP